MSISIVEASESELREGLTAILRATPPLMGVLSVARGLCLPDWLVFSGAVYQPVLNHLTGRPLDYGIKDYDLGYFDASDISYEAEDAVIRRVEAAFDEPLRSMVEVRNQARVHLWFETKFREPYGPLSCTAEALERFASATFAVGVRLESDDRLYIEAPFGLADLFALRPRPNPRRKTVGFARTAGPDRDARMAAPQETTKEGKAGSAPHIFSWYPTRLDNLEQEAKAMTKILDEVLAANAKYAENFGDKGNLPLPPSRHFAILTCMDARLDPAKYAGLAEGDAHVIRNAGGRASDDAIRSLVISYKLLGTREWFVIHHTDCGMLLFTNDDMRNLLASSLKTATLDQSGWRDSGEGPGSTEGSYINWLPFTDNAKSVVEDVIRIRHHPLVPNDIPIYGYIYDVKSGILVEVPEATTAGKAG